MDSLLSFFKVAAENDATLSGNRMESLLLYFRVPASENDMTLSGNRLAICSAMFLMLLANTLFYTITLNISLIVSTVFLCCALCIAKYSSTIAYGSLFSFAFQCEETDIPIIKRMWITVQIMASIFGALPYLQRPYWLQNVGLDASTVRILRYLSGFSRTCMLFFIVWRYHQHPKNKKQNWVRVGFFISYQLTIMYTHQIADADDTSSIRAAILFLVFMACIIHVVVYDQYKELVYCTNYSHDLGTVFALAQIFGGKLLIYDVIVSA